MMTTATPTMVQPGLAITEPFVWTMFPNVVHIRDASRIDRTACGQMARYYARAGDTRSWPLCHTCEQAINGLEEKAS